MNAISLPNARAAMRGPDLHSYDRIVVAFSGGKDSVASLLTVLDAGVPPERIDVYHHDVDGNGPSFMDWPSTTAYCRAVTRALGVPLYSELEGGRLPPRDAARRCTDRADLLREAGRHRGQGRRAWVRMAPVSAFPRSRPT